MKKNKSSCVFCVLCFLFLLTHYSSKAQECDYQKLYNRGVTLYIKGKYPEALKKFNSAKACSPGKTKEVDGQIQRLFEKIRKQKEAAIKDKKEAIEAKKLAVEALNKANASEQKMKLAEEKQAVAENKSAAMEAELSAIKKGNISAILKGSTDGENAVAKNKDSLNARQTNSNIEPKPIKQHGDSLNKPIARRSNVILLAQIKATLDSLTKLKSPKQSKLFNDADFDFALEGKLRDSICDDAEHYCKKRFFQLKSQIQSLRLAKNNINEKLLFSYVRSAYYFAWDFIDNNEYSDAMEISNEAEAVLNDIKSPAQYFYCLAGFENIKESYFTHVGKYDNAFEHATSAIDFAHRAVLIKAQNIYYLKSLSTFLENMKAIMPDSLLSPREKQEYSHLSLEIANYINKIKDNGFAASGFYYCVTDEVQNNANDNAKAENILNSAISDMNKFIVNNPKDYSKLIYRAGFYLKIADIRAKEKDTSGQIDYLIPAVDDWVLYTKANKMSITDIGNFKDVYNSIVTHYSEIYKGEKLNDENKFISAALNNLKPSYLKQPKVAAIIYYLNKFIGAQNLKNTNLKDSVEALTYYLKANEGFENSRILKEYSEFSEDYSSFLLSYSKCIELNIKYNHYLQAADNYKKINDIFLPIFQKYPFDINIGDYLTFVNKSFGEYLYNRGLYRDAIKPLDSASYHGDKSSTGYLIKIYLTKQFNDTVKSNFYNLRDQSQSEGKEKYTITASLAGESKSIYIDIFDRAKGYRYKGIEDQAIWWKTARNIIIPESTVEVFTKIQDIAWRYNTSFKDLVTTSLKTEKNKEILLPYENLKKRISLEKNTTKRNRLIDSLSGLYDVNIQKDTLNRNVIKEDAIKSHEDYAELLLKNKQVSNAQYLYNKILKLDSGNSVAKNGLIRIKFDLYKNDANILINTDDIDELSQFLDFYAEGSGNKKNVLIMIAKMHTELEKAYARLKSESSTKEKEILSIYYNNLAWSCLLYNVTDNVVSYLKKSIMLDPTDLYPQGNLPHAYLLTGNFETAKGKYLELKNKQFDNKRTFKNVFISDLEQFKKRGNKNRDIQKILDILKSK